MHSSSSHITTVLVEHALTGTRRHSGGTTQTLWIKSRTAGTGILGWIMQPRTSCYILVRPGIQSNHQDTHTHMHTTDRVWCSINVSSFTCLTLRRTPTSHSRRSIRRRGVESILPLVTVRCLHDVQCQPFTRQLLRLRATAYKGLFSFSFFFLIADKKNIISMYITRVILCLFSDLIRRVGALQISIIIIYYYCPRRNQLSFLKNDDRQWRRLTLPQRPVLVLQ